MFGFSTLSDSELLPDITKQSEDADRVEGKQYRGPFNIRGDKGDVIEVFCSGYIATARRL